MSVKWQVIKKLQAQNVRLVDTQSLTGVSCLKESLKVAREVFPHALPPLQLALADVTALVGPETFEVSLEGKLRTLRLPQCRGRATPCMPVPLTWPAPPTAVELCWAFPLVTSQMAEDLQKNFMAAAWHKGSEP